MQQRTAGLSARPFGRLASAAFVLAASIGVIAYALPSRALAGTAAPGWTSNEIGPPGEALADLSCPVSGFCVAVGSGFTLATMSGVNWSTVEPPLPTINPAGVGTTAGNLAPGPDLVSVSCASSAFCVAVGTYADSLGFEWGVVETWNGASWTASAAALPAGDDPDGYPAAPEPYAPPSGEQSGLSAVSCPATGSCVAVGQYRDSNGTDWGLVETLSGGSWSASTAPEPTSAPDGSVGYGSQADLLSVSCSSPNHCAAAGNYVDAGSAWYGLLEWDGGGSWTSQVAPEPASNQAGEGPGYRSANASSSGLGDVLNTLSCGGSGCVAIGYYLDTTSAQWGLLESSSNGTWSATAAPEPARDLSGVGPAAEANVPGGNPDAVTAVSCPPSGACLAVGWFVNADDELWGDALSGSGTSWSPATLPEPAESTVGTAAVNDAALASPNHNIEPADPLYGVSCWSAGQCLAVGSFASQLPDWYTPGIPPVPYSTYPMADLLSGGNWSAVAAPAPADLEFETNQAPVQAEFAGASCAPDGSCAAFGRYPSSQSFYQAMVDGYLEPAPSPPSLVPSGVGTTVNALPAVSGSLYAIGDNRFGELGTTTGLGGTDDSPVRVQLPGATGAVTAVAVGADASLAATTSGQLYSFGSNPDGELGDGAGLGYQSSNPTPALVSLPGQQGAITDLAAGTWSSYAVTASGQLYAFGSNLFGQLGTSTDSHTWLPQPTPALVEFPASAGGVSQVVAGVDFALVLTTSGQLYAFGSNETGALATPTDAGAPTPQPTPAEVAIPGATGRVVQIAAGAEHALALTSSGQLFSFGSDSVGQLGDGAFGGLGIKPTLVTLPGQQGSIISVAGGAAHSLVVTSSGQLYAFGDDSNGELGDGGPIHTPGGILHSLVTTPELVALPPDAGTPVAVEAIGWSTLALTSNGELWGFGANTFGVLGPASSGADVLTPTRIQIDGTAPVLAVSAGPVGQQTLAIVDDGIPIVPPTPPPSPAPAPAPSPSPAGGTSAVTTTTVPTVQPASAASYVPQALLGGARLSVRGARVGVLVACRGATCDGSIRITTRPDARAASHHGAPRHRVLLLGSASYRVAPGQAVAISVKLDRTGRLLLAKATGHRLLAVVVVTVGGGSRLSTDVVISPLH